MMQDEWLCADENATIKAAGQINDMIGAGRAILCLYGDLGAGKTAFCRGLIRHRLNRPDENVPSPTYSLVQTYDDGDIWHFDLYRLNHPDDLYDIGWEEAVTAPLCLIEWPDRLGGLKPKGTIDITLEKQSETTRKIHVTWPS